MGNKDDSKDYVPNRETDLASRMTEGASVADGLAGRVTAQQDGVSHRQYIKNGEPDPMAKYKRSGDFGY